MVCAEEINIQGGSVHSIKKNTESLVAVSKETGLEVIAGNTKYMVTLRVRKSQYDD
jgi:hypothetical protein